jgi:hypothetical protein
MAFTQLQLLNMALDFLNEKPITDIDSTTDKTAVIAKRIWPFALDEFLTAWPWSWARKRARFVPKTDASPATTTNGAFTMPAVGSTVNVTFTAAVATIASPDDTLIIGTNRMTMTAIVSTYVATMTNDSSANESAGTVIASGTAIAFEADAPLTKWTYHYVIPSDLVTLIAINETYADTPSDTWEIEGACLITDEESVIGEYVRRWGGVPSTETLDAYLAFMDPLCGNALAVLLASKLAPKVAQDGLNKAATLMQMYEMSVLPRARVRVGNQQRPAPRFPQATSTAYARRMA